MHPVLKWLSVVTPIVSIFLGGYYWRSVSISATLKPDLTTDYSKGEEVIMVKGKIIFGCNIENIHVYSFIYCVLRQMLRAFMTLNMSTLMEMSSPWNNTGNNDTFQDNVIFQQISGFNNVYI